MNLTLLKRLKALIIFRAFFVTLLLGTFLLFNIGLYKFPYPRTTNYLIISLYIVTAIYAFLLPRIRNLIVFAYVQLIVDAGSAVVLIFLTGGIESWFFSIMIFTVMEAAIILDKRAGFIIATVCSILYGSMIDLQFYRILPIAYDPALREKDFLYNIFTLISALYLTAYLTGHLSSRLEKTARRLEEKDSSLKDLTLFNKELIENLPSGLLTTDPSSRIVLFNKSAEQITGLSRTDASGCSITDMFPFLTLPLQAGRQNGGILCAGEPKTVGLTISSTADSDGNQTGYICVFQDITKLMMLEAELKHKATLAAIGELSANMAHEIRNPLASLKGSIEMLKEGALTAEQSGKLMNIAIGEMDRLNKIITDFLTYSRPKPPAFAWVDVHAILEETMELMRHSVQDGHRIVVRKDFHDVLTVYADAGKLRQVFLNLGTNAFEAMPEGGALVITTRRAGSAAIIIFEDTGAGISPEIMRQVFFPFFTTKDTGTGLGLSIAYRIMEEHRGTIHVSSTPGKGTTFEISLPVDPTGQGGKRPKQAFATEMI